MSKNKLKKAAVYDRWLYTLGGGEQVAFAYAEGLRDLGYQTHLLTHRTVDIEKAQQKMNVNLEGIEIQYLPNVSTQAVSEYTEKYDVFINTSYLDYFPNRSKFGILSVFFPDILWISPFEYFKRKLPIPTLRKLFIYPLHFEGFLYDEYYSRKLYKWLGKESKIAFSKHIDSFSIVLYFESLAFSVIDSLQFFDGENELKPSFRKVDHKNNFIKFTFQPATQHPTDFRIVLPETEYSKKVALVKLTIPNYRYLLYNIFKKFFPQWEMRLHGGPGITKKSDLQSYDSIVTISDFCQYWISKYWGLPSRVLYPPVNTQHFKPADRKKKQIVHVGRFFVTGHNKKQLELVKAFKKMYDQHQMNDWELHFVGSVHDGEQHKNYYQKVVAEAQNYPVHFHIDASFEELQELLSESKIYWHATGYGHDEKTEPILFEHFGITTVEAMAAGCVPVVIAGGGQREIVTPEAGFLWNSLDELIEQTVTLIHKPKLLLAMRDQAITRSKHFSRSAFKKRFAKLLPEK